MKLMRMLSWKARRERDDGIADADGANVSWIGRSLLKDVSGSVSSAVDGDVCEVVGDFNVEADSPGDLIVGNKTAAPEDSGECAEEAVEGFSKVTWMKLFSG